MARRATPTVAEILETSRITWTHFYADGTEVVRTGTVWNAGPVLSGSGTLWVTPDVQDSGDMYPPCVLVATARRRSLVGRMWGECWEPCGGRYLTKGEHYSEQHPHSATGAEGLRAAQITQRTTA